MHKPSHHWKLGDLNSAAEFLIQVYEHKKNTNPRYSLRAFARDLQCSVAHLSDVFGNKTHPVVPIVLRLAHSLCLRSGEVDYLISLAQTSLQKDPETRQYFMEFSERIKHSENIVLEDNLKEIFRFKELKKVYNYYNALTDTHRRLYQYTVQSQLAKDKLVFVDCTFSPQKDKYNTAFIFKDQSGNYFLGNHSQNNRSIRIENRISVDKNFHWQLDSYDFPVFKNIWLRTLGQQDWTPCDLKFSMANATAFNAASNEIVTQYRYFCDPNNIKSKLKQ